MFVIERIDPLKLTVTESEELKALCDVSIYPYLESTEIPSILFATLFEGTFISLLICKLNQTLKLGEVIWIYVDERYRNQKIATNLLISLQEEMALNNYQLVLCTFPSKKPYSTILERIFAFLGWSPPKITHINCTFDGFTFDPPWLSIDRPISEEFMIFPWKELQPFEREKLCYQFEKRMFPHEISPFDDEADIEYLNSLGLRHKGTVIGWVITHRISKDRIKYSCLYINQHWQHSGIAIKLLSEAIARQKQAGVKWAELSVNVILTEVSWVKFVEKRLIPYALEVEYKKQVWKALI